MTVRRRARSGSVREVEVARLIEAPSLAPVVFVERKVLLRLGYRKGAAEVAPAVRASSARRRDRARGLVRPAIAAALLEKAELPDHAGIPRRGKGRPVRLHHRPGARRGRGPLMAEGDLLRGLVLDWLGSEAVTDVSRQAGALAGAGRPGPKGFGRARCSRRATRAGTSPARNSSSPSVPASTIGVRLSPSFMMMPRKSFSFRINFYKDREPTTRKGL